MKSKYLDQNTVDRIVIALTDEKAAKDLIEAIEEGILGPNAVNKLTKHVSLSGGDDIAGNGSLGFPYKTLEKALASIPNPVDAGYTIMLAPGEYTSATGSYTLRGGISIIGSNPSNTSLGSPCNLTSEAGETTICQFYGMSMSTLNLDLSLAAFASISFNNGRVNINRIDSNPAGVISFYGGIFESTISGGNILLSGFIFEDITVESGASVYCSAVSSLGGKFLLEGTAHLKTVGGLFSANGAMVDGTTICPDTPTWETDVASDFGFTGRVTKTVL